MTRHLPPHVLRTLRPAVVLHDEAIAQIFAQADRWQRDAALAALYRLRPDLGDSDPGWHDLHLRAIARAADDGYFVRACRLLKLFGVGGDL